MTPGGATAPLAVEGYEWSTDLRRALLFTNSRRVWRENTRGDYWLLDRSARTLRKIGGAAPESSLMFAKLSPDGTRAIRGAFRWSPDGRSIAREPSS